MISRLNYLTSLQKFCINVKFGHVGHFLKWERLHGRHSRDKGRSECRLSDNGWDNRYFSSGDVHREGFMGNRIPGRSMPCSVMIVKCEIYSEKVGCQPHLEIGLDGHHPSKEPIDPFLRE